MQNAGSYFPQFQTPNAPATQAGINQLTQFNNTGGNGAMDVLSQYMNQGLNPNMNNYMNKLGQQMTTQRQNTVNDIGAQFGRGGTSASRLATEKVAPGLDTGGANMLNAQMNAQATNAQTRMGAAGQYGQLGQALMTAPSTLEQALLGNQYKYDTLNAGQGAGLAQMMQQLLQAQGGQIYQQGDWVGGPNDANNSANLIGQLMSALASMFG
jgi:hypothetical protein